LGTFPGTFPEGFYEVTFSNQNADIEKVNLTGTNLFGRVNDNIMDANERWMSRQPEIPKRCGGIHV
jgi:hypothetical protein